MLYSHKLFERLPKTSDDVLTQKEIDFINSMRAEAADVKDCYTRFSFQSWIFSAAALGIIARLQAEIPVIGLLSLLPPSYIAFGRKNWHS